MTQSESAILQAIQHAKEGNPNEMKSSLDAAINNKITDAINLKKIAIAGNLFNDNAETTEETFEELSNDERIGQRKAMHKANDDAHASGGVTSLGHGVTKRNIEAGHHDSDRKTGAPRIGRHQDKIQQARRGAIARARHAERNPNE